MARVRKARASAESRKALLRRMSTKSTDRIDKVIPFSNDDVPNYLKGLRRFEEWSRKAEINLVVK